MPLLQGAFAKKKKQETIRRLSECKPVEKIAFCPRCEEFFIDDLTMFRYVQCPNEKDGMLLQRGFTIKDGIVYDAGGRKFRSLK